MDFSESTRLPLIHIWISINIPGDSPFAEFAKARCPRLNFIHNPRKLLLKIHPKIHTFKYEFSTSSAVLGKDTCCDVDGGFLEPLSKKIYWRSLIMFLYMKIVPKDKGVYSFSASHEPAEWVKPGELIILEMEDAVGGQIKSEDVAMESLDWSRVNKATGPIYVEGAERGDTLVVDILDIQLADQGIILVIPGAGVLGDFKFRPKAKIMKIKDGLAIFDDVKLLVKPVIGTIGVAPQEGEIPTSTPYKHGGNMDCTEITKGTRLYLPVAVEGALFAAGDLHAVQEDGELCVASIEVEGRILLKFDILKKRAPEWPIVETEDHFSILTADEDLDKAVKIAAEQAVNALLRAKKWSFEEAYMFSSLGVRVAINQVVDPKKGARAIISKQLVSISDLLVEK